LAFSSEIYIKLKKNYRKGSEKTAFLSNSMKRAVGFSLSRSWKHRICCLVERKKVICKDSIVTFS
jgi:hypothetical protein